MSSTLDETADSDHTRRHMTTLLLEKRGDDEWIVTQGGVDVEGEGPTAAAAAADYCRQIDDDTDCTGSEYRLRARPHRTSSRSTFEYAGYETVAEPTTIQRREQP